VTTHEVELLVGRRRLGLVPELVKISEVTVKRWGMQNEQPRCASRPVAESVRYSTRYQHPPSGSTDPFATLKEEGDLTLENVVGLVTGKVAVSGWHPPTGGKLTFHQ